MKKVLILSVILVLCAVGSVFAAPAKSGAGLTIDGSLSIASETYNGYDAALGFGFGASYDLSDVVRLSESKLLARADFNFYSSSKDYGFGELDSTRIPFFVGARYVLPLRLPVDLFAEAGIELSFDKREDPFWVYKVEVSETNLGMTPGFGVIFPLGNNMSIGANARLHTISNSYMSFSFSFGYSF